MGTSERNHRIAGVIWAAVWMWPLLNPIGAMLRGEVHPLWPAAVGLAVFAVLYLAVVVVAFDGQQPAPPYAMRLLAATAVVGAALALGYARQPTGWLTTLLYVTVAGTATLWNPRHVAVWLFGWSAIAVAIGVSAGAPASDLGSGVFGTFMAGVLVYTIRQMVQLIRKLRQTQQALAESAVAQERLRFSRDLHDLLGHTLSLMVVKAELTRRLAPRDPAAAASEARDIETIGRKALAEVREAVTGYRDRVFADELDGARTALADAGIDVTVRESGSPLPSAVNDVFGWAVREASTNVIRHSGATTCEIDLRYDGETAVLQIVDNGVNQPAAAGNGLRGLSERVDGLGGTLRAEPAPGGGFGVRAEVPAGAVRAPVQPAPPWSGSLASGLA